MSEPDRAKAGIQYRYRIETFPQYERRTFQASPTTCFPCPVAVASTWDVKLVEELGVLMAGQAKAQGVHAILAPTINIQRSPLGGRNFESYSEDPFLSGSVGSALVRGIQSEGIASTLKHFVCNDQETDRKKIDVIVEPRALREIYLKPFQIVVKNSRPWTVMASYNRVNGLHVSESPHLLEGILRNEWGWRGLIISDWFATYSTTEALNAGLDLEMPGKTEWRGKLVMRSVHAGKLDGATIKERARNVLDFVEKTRASGIPEDADEKENNSAEVRAMNRKAATESIVLLKNTSRVLPIRKPGKVAVIGPNAHGELYCGGGSSIVFPYYFVSAFDGIKRAVADADPSSSLVFAQGCYKHELLPLLQTTSTPGHDGLTLEFYDGDFTLESNANKVWETHSHTWRLVFIDSLPKDVLPWVFARFSGRYTAPAGGDFEFGIITTGRARLYVDGALLVDNWTNQERGNQFFGFGTVEVHGVLPLIAGRSYEIMVEYSNISSFVDRSVGDIGGGILRVGVCQVVDPEVLLNQAVEAAASADTVICVVGTDQEHESEGFDRKDMKLPGAQDRLVEAVLKANPRTVVVNISGAPVEMPWIEQASTVVQGWFLGSEMGNALGDVLLGVVSPSGKLPVTFPRKLEHNPSFGNFPGENDRVRYAEGILVGYRHYSTRHIDTLFPFGHGLSYTEFGYSDLVIETGNIKHPDAAMTVSVTVSNNGDCPGHETVQLYISATSSSVFRPAVELQGFQKVRDLRPGERRKVAFSLDKYSVSYYDEKRLKWCAEAGKYRVSVGASVEDLRLSILIELPTTFYWTGL